MNSNQRETARRILFKFVREQDKILALQSFWAYIQHEVHAVRHNDGYVDWNIVEGNVEDTLDQFKEHLESWSLPAPDREDAVAEFDSELYRETEGSHD